MLVYIARIVILPNSWTDVGVQCISAHCTLEEAANASQDKVDEINGSKNLRAQTYCTLVLPLEV